MYGERRYWYGVEGAFSKGSRVKVWTWCFELLVAFDVWCLGSGLTADASAAGAAKGM